METADSSDEDSSSSETESENGEEVSQNVSFSLENLSFEHHACFAHTLQLVVKDGLKNCPANLPM